MASAVPCKASERLTVLEAVTSNPYVAHQIPGRSCVNLSSGCGEYIQSFARNVNPTGANRNQGISMNFAGFKFFSKFDNSFQT